MDTSYCGCCGNDCGACPYRAALGCGMCPGLSGSPGDCPIAQCCRDSGLPSCGDCDRRAECGKLSGAEAMPRERLRIRNAQWAQQIRRDKTMIPRIILMLTLPLCGAFLVLIFALVQRRPLSASNVWLSVFTRLAAIGPGIVMLTAGSVRKPFAKAGVWSLCGVALQIIAAALGYQILRSVAVIVPLLCATVSTYYQTRGFAALTALYDIDIAKGWRLLWPLDLAMVISSVVLLVSAALIMSISDKYLIPVMLFLLLTALFAVGVAVFQIVQYIRTILCLARLRPPAEE